MERDLLRLMDHEQWVETEDESEPAASSEDGQEQEERGKQGEEGEYPQGEELERLLEENFFVTEEAQEYLLTEVSSKAQGPLDMIRGLVERMSNLATQAVGLISQIPSRQQLQAALRKLGKALEYAVRFPTNCLLSGHFHCTNKQKYHIHLHIQS